MISNHRRKKKIKAESLKVDIKLYHRHDFSLILKVQLEKENNKNFQKILNQFTRYWKNNC